MEMIKWRKKVKEKEEEDFLMEFKRNLKFIESYYIAIYKVLSVHCYV